MSLPAQEPCLGQVYIECINIKIFCLQEKKMEILKLNTTLFELRILQVSI